MYVARPWSFDSIWHWWCLRTACAHPLGDWSIFPAVLAVSSGISPKPDSADCEARDRGMIEGL